MESEANLFYVNAYRDDVLLWRLGPFEQVEPAEIAASNMDKAHHKVNAPIGAAERPTR